MARRFIIRSASEEEKILSLAMQFRQASHPRDARVTCVDRRLVVDSDTTPAGRYTTVSKFLEAAFGSFPADAIADALVRRKDPRYADMTAEQIKAQWNAKSRAAADRGTRIHKAIETYVKGGERSDAIPAGLHRGFLAFRADYPQYQLVSAEQVIFDEDARLIGRMDLLFKDTSDDTHVYVEVKTHQKDMNEYFTDDPKFASARLMDLSLLDTPILRSTFQCALYQYIYNRNYDGRIALSCILHLRDPDLNSADYDLLACPPFAIEGFIEDHKARR